MECAICLATLAQGAIASTPCGHVFHLLCATALRPVPSQRLSGVRVPCPTCRTMFSAVVSQPDGCLRRIFLGDTLASEDSQELLQSCERERDTARAEVARLRQSLAAEQNKNDSLERQFLAVDTQLQQSRQENARMRAINWDLATSYNQLLETNRIAQLQLEELRVQRPDLAVWQQALAAESEEHDAIKEALMQATRACDTLSHKLDEEKDMNAALRGRIRTSEEQARLNENELRAKDVRLQEQQDQLRVQREQLLDNENCLQDFRQRFLGMRSLFESSPSPASSEQEGDSELPATPAVAVLPGLNENRVRRHESSSNGGSSNVVPTSDPATSTVQRPQNEDVLHEADRDAASSVSSSLTAPPEPGSDSHCVSVSASSFLAPVASNVGTCSGGAHDWCRRGTNGAMRRYRCKLCDELHREKMVNGCWVEI